MSKRNISRVYNKPGSSSEDDTKSDSGFEKHFKAYNSSDEEEANEKKKHSEKLSFGINSKKNDGKKIESTNKINIKLKNIVEEKEKTQNKLLVNKPSVFNESDSEPEEMPKEAKMRMRNIGRDTPTSSGPNSFGKTKQGFCHLKKMYEKSIENALKEMENK